MDKEKIEKGLSICTSAEPCKGCPYLKVRNCRSAIIKDALDLLKEQEERIKVLQRTIERMPKPVKLLDVLGNNYEKIVLNGMRLIDADSLIEEINKVYDVEKNEDQKWAKGLYYAKGIIRNMPTIPYDMKWNPECEDCLPEGINDCIECHKRQEGR